MLYEQSDIQKTPAGLLSFAYKTCMLRPGNLLLSDLISFVKPLLIKTATETLIVGSLGLSLISMLECQTSFLHEYALYCIFYSYKKLGRGDSNPGSFHEGDRRRLVMQLL